MLCHLILYHVVSYYNKSYCSTLYTMSYRGFRICVCEWKEILQIIGSHGVQPHLEVHWQAEGERERLYYAEKQWAWDIRQPIYIYIYIWLKRKTPNRVGKEHLESSGSGIIWDHLVWNHLGSSGSEVIWDHLVWDRLVSSCRSSVIIWAHLGSFGSGIIWDVSSGIIWDHLGSSGSGIIWDHLGSSGSGIIWDHLVWDHLGPCGIIWDHLGSSGVIWGHLGASGVIPGHLGLLKAFGSNYCNTFQLKCNSSRKPLKRLGVLKVGVTKSCK